MEQSMALDVRTGAESVAGTKRKTAGLAFALTWLGFKRSDPNE
jgi:hypothetical protein